MSLKNVHIKKIVFSLNIWIIWATDNRSESRAKHGHLEVTLTRYCYLTASGSPYRYNKVENFIYQNLSLRLLYQNFFWENQAECEKKCIAKALGKLCLMQNEGDWEEESCRGLQPSEHKRTQLVRRSINVNGALREGALQDAGELRKADSPQIELLEVFHKESRT